MRLLFAITVCAFFAVLWVALALARRIQRNQGLNVRSNRRPAAREFFEAGEFRTPRSLTLNQEIHQQRPRRPLAEIASASNPEGESSAWNSLARNPLTQKSAARNAQTANTDIRNGHISRDSEPKVLTSPPSRATFDQESGRITISDSRPPSILSSPTPATPFLPTAEDTDLITASAGPEPTQFPGHRIPPSPDRVSGLRRRVDLSHYTKDMGDLTDPSYNHSRQGSGTRGPGSVHHRDR